MKGYPGIGAALSALLAVGCASVPVHYYSLVASPSLPAGTTAYCCRIVIASIKLPPAADRPEIVVRESDNQLLVLGNDLWIAPLRDEMRTALTNEIRRNLARLDKGSQDAPSTIHVDVERFESQPSKQALIQIGWRVSVPGQPRELTTSCETVSQIAVGDGVPALVQGYQQAVSAIGAQIAAGISNLRTSGENGCGPA